MTLVLASALGAQLLQIAGAMLVLLAFAGAQAGRLGQSSAPYLWLNVVGSGLLSVLAIIERQWGFLLLESVWFLVSAWGLVQRARGTSPTPAGAG